MIDLLIESICKRRGSRDKWTMFNQEVKVFEGIAEARAYLKDRFYYASKPQSIYQDTRSKGTIQVGRIYKWTEDENWIQEWVNFYDHATRLPINPRNGRKYYSDEEAIKLMRERDGEP